MARTEAANELDALKAQLADFALKNAAEAIAKDPKKFLSSDLMKAVEQAALAAVEARLAREPRPSPEDFAEQVLAQVRPELAAAVHGAAAAAPRGARNIREAVAQPPGDSLMRELRRHWATVAVGALVVAAAGGAIGFLAGQGLARADIDAAAAGQRFDTESTDVGPVTYVPPARNEAAPVADQRARPAGAGDASGTTRPPQ